MEDTIGYISVSLEDIASSLHIISESKKGYNLNNISIIASGALAAGIDPEKVAKCARDVYQDIQDQMKD